VTSHKWPPVWYEEKMEEYRKKYLENTEEEKEEKEGEGTEAEGTAGERTRRGRGFLKKLSLNRLVRGIA